VEQYTARVRGSYRHVCFERHPRRTLRLVHQVRRIEWQLCNSPEAAIERERELLLALRPPFNRAGVWQGTPWWLRMEQRDGLLRFALHRGETAALDTSEISTTTSAPFMNFAEAEPFAPEQTSAASVLPCRVSLCLCSTDAHSVAMVIGPIFHS